MRSARRAGVRGLSHVLVGLALFGAGAAFLAVDSGVPIAEAAGVGSAQASPGPGTDETTREGQVLYEERCASCHGADAAGTEAGPPIVGLGPAAYDFQLSTGRMPLVQPGARSVRKPPAFDPGGIEALVAYLTSLGGEGVPIPTIDPASGDLSDGQRLFQSNCAPCHGVAGNGGAVGTAVAPAVHEATAVQAAEAVRYGPGTMPPFGPEILSDDDLDSLVRYSLFLRTAEDPGGLGLGRTGPIVEGFVALLVGLGVTLLIVRSIGRTT
ncbi:MAG: c-type cytochrome [Actinobacteria bacterium]|nr:c-type cytochrome [Actinomycetota bacterium]